MKHIALALLAFVASAASGQVVVRDHVQIDLGGIGVAAAQSAAECAGPTVGYLVLRPGAVEVYDTAKTYTMGTPLAGSVTVETTCGSTSADIAPSYALTGTSDYLSSGLLQYHYEPISEAEILRVPLRRGEAVLTSTYVINGVTHEVSHAPIYIETGVKELSNALFGCYLWSCDEDSVGANVTTNRAYEGLASGFVALWPPAATCGTQMPLELRAVRADGAEGYLHPETMLWASLYAAS